MRAMSCRHLRLAGSVPAHSHSSGFTSAHPKELLFAECQAVLVLKRLGPRLVAQKSAIALPQLQTPPVLYIGFYIGYSAAAKAMVLVDFSCTYPKATQRFFCLLVYVYRLALRQNVRIEDSVYWYSDWPHSLFAWICKLQLYLD